jgi:hypothetical protein
MDALLLDHESGIGPRAGGLSRLEADFTVQIATAVWLSRLSEDSALEALNAYAIASERGKRAQVRLRVELLREFRRCRERQDICS